jgi:hypothetical protein
VPGVDGVLEDLAKNLDQALLSSALLREAQLQDILQFFGPLIVHQRFTNCRMVSVDSSALVGLLSFLAKRVLVRGSDEGNQKVLDCAQKLFNENRR